MAPPTGRVFGNPIHQAAAFISSQAPPPAAAPPAVATLPSAGASFCSGCGAALDGDGKFCKGCAKAV